MLDQILPWLGIIPRHINPYDIYGKCGNVFISFKDFVYFLANVKSNSLPLFRIYWKDMNSNSTHLHANKTDCSR